MRVKNPRRFRHRMDVQRLKDSPPEDDFGGVDKSRDDVWEPYITRWFEIRPVTGREAMRGGQTTPINQMRLYTVSDTETRCITPDMRIVWNGRKLNIESSIDLGGMNREIEIVCKESA